MRGRVERYREVAVDGLGAAHDGLAFARAQYWEARRRRSESELFAAAFEAASSIGGWLRRSEAELLFELARSVPPGRDVVEVGSYLGRSTAFLAMGLGEGGSVHAIDPHSGDRSQVEEGLEGIDTSKQFHRNMVAVGAGEKVQAHVMVSVEAARSYSGRPVGLLFIDGWHSEAAVCEDGEAWAPFLAPHALVVFDDIDDPEVSRGVTRLVDGKVVPALRGSVGKVGLCGPSSLWPPRVKAITRLRRSR